MNFGLDKIRVGLGLGFAATLLVPPIVPGPAAGQDSANSAASTHTRWVMNSSGQAAAGVSQPGRLYRVLPDPNGSRWLLYRDPKHPGGPGQLVLIPARPDARNQDKKQDAADEYLAQILPAIHAGEKLIVEESTPVAEARLRAVALESAPAGAVIAVRLEIGGRVVHAVLTGPGRARLQAN